MSAVTMLPTQTRRMVARQVGCSFREVAHVVAEDLPPLLETEALVRVTHVGINGGCETFRARGEQAFSRLKDRKNFPLGAEGSGVVVAVGQSVIGLEPGTPVACNSATFTEYAVVDASRCTPVKSASAAAAAVVLSGVFAAVAIHGAGKVRRGDRVLITAGAGAAGSFAIQLAKHAGAHVTTTVGSSTKEATAARLGADIVINYSKSSSLGVELAAASSGGFNVVMDGVGGELQDAAMPCLAQGGRYLQTGYISEYPHARPGKHTGSREDANLVPGCTLPMSNAELFWQSKEVSLGDGKTWTGNIWGQDVSVIRTCRDTAFRLFQSNELEAVLDDKVFRGLEAIPDAVDHMLSGMATGKVVVEV